MHSWSMGNWLLLVLSFKVHERGLRVGRRCLTDPGWSSEVIGNRAEAGFS